MFPPVFGRGRRTCLGCRLGRFAAERHWRSLTPRHAPRGTRPHLVAEPLCPLTKNREASIVLTSLFLAGAEGLEPSARGFGVDVGERTREREMGGVARFPPQVTKQAVLVWCCEHFWEAEPTKSVKMLSKNSFIFLAYLSSYRTVKYLFFY